MTQKVSLILFMSISIFMIGCGNKNPYKEENKNIVRYNILNNNYKIEGKHHLIINEIVNDKKVRTVKEVVIYNSELPKTIIFDGCETIKTIKVFEKTKNEYVYNQDIHGKKFYIKSDCKSTLNFSKDGNKINIEGVIKTIRFMEYNGNQTQPLIPLVQDGYVKTSISL